MQGEGLFCVALDPVQIGKLPGGDEGDGDARCPGPSGAADAVDVILGEAGQVVVDDVADAGDVEPAGGHVGGHKEPDLPTAHVDDGAVACSLAHVAV